MLDVDIDALELLGYAGSLPPKGDLLEDVNLDHELLGNDFAVSNSYTGTSGVHVAQWIGECRERTSECLCGRYPRGPHFQFLTVKCRPVFGQARIDFPETSHGPSSWSPTFAIASKSIP